MPPRPREREQVGRRGRPLGHLRLGRPAAAHRDHDHLAVTAEQPRGVPGDRGLADALAGADDPERRERERLERRRVEAEVRARVGDSGREHAARDEEALARPEHRLVGEVVDQLRLAGGERLVEVAVERHAVLVAAAQLLLAPGEPGAGDVVGKARERVPHDGRVVLAVDHHERAGHVRVVTSPSILAVYFSKARVSVENWMIRSWPWNG